MRVVVAVLLFCLLHGIAFARDELKVSRAWCQRRGGRVEYRLPDGTRVDCLTDKYAVEVEYAPKWAEAVGQSLYYASYFPNRLPAIALIVDQRSGRYVRRLIRTLRTYDLPIRVFIIFEPKHDK